MDLVTGATGHLGNVLVRTLIAKGKKVRAMVLPNEDLRPLEGLDAEIVAGDVRDANVVLKASKGVETVYHLAAVISIFGNTRLVYDVNVEGTKNIIKACMKNRVPKLVYVSSVHALAELKKGSLIDESVPIDPNFVSGHYAKSKAMATNEVLKAANEGYDAVVVFPSGIIGPYDWKVSEMGSLILYFCKGALKVAVTGGFDFVDVRDVAEGIIKVSDNFVRGEKFILSGEYVSVRAIVQMLEKILGRKSLPIFLPDLVAYPLSIVHVLWSRVKHVKALLTPYSVFTLSRGYIYSHQKVHERFGYSPRSVFESLRDAVSWFIGNGYISSKTVTTAFFENLG